VSLDQPPLFEVPPIPRRPVVYLARATDPETSHEAAESIGDRSQTQVRILALLETFGAMADEEIIKAYRARWPCSDSGIRSRRHELVTEGAVRDSGERVLTAAGRRSIAWCRT
jgi:hypothetical protein